MSNNLGILYVVATPIGNLGDISARAQTVFRDVDLILAEDTRRTRQLLQHLNIDTACSALHEHNERQRVSSLIEQLTNGSSFALVSDAGTPLVSDPGYVLVNAAQAAGIRVSPIPGASAAMAALSAAGLPSDRFVFEGFLPAKAGAREQALTGLKSESRTLIFYEAPHRIVATLAAMESVFGPQREVVLAREITKTFETIRRLPVSEMLVWVSEDADQQKGEIVLLVAGASEAALTGSIEATTLLQALLKELPATKAAVVAAKVLGGTKQTYYELALELKK